MQTRPDLTTAMQRAWADIGQPGTWWTGAQRVAIAAEARHAAGCRLCEERRKALTPAAVSGAHDTLGVLPAAAIDAVHRIRTDSGRLGETWYRGLLRDGLTEETYVELVATVAIVIAVDTLHRTLGLPPPRLPEALPGEPSRRRPRGARRDAAWVATLAPEDRGDDDPDLYKEHPGPRERYGANVHRALSLVPAAMMQWWDMLEVMYMTSPQMRDFAREPRAVTHAQMEMLAARVAALNQCLY